MEEKFNDNCLMPFGKHKGKKIKHIPDEYLFWLHGELDHHCSPFAKPLKHYLDENLEAIKLNIEQKYPKSKWTD